MFAVLIHVGQTPTIPPLGKNPIFSDGAFRFVPIYVDPPRPIQDPTYEELGFANIVNPSYRSLPAFRSPEFETLTYNHITRGGEGNIYEMLRRDRGYMLFYSTLFYQDKIPPTFEQISPSKGAYVIGYFEVEGMYKNEEIMASSKLQDRFKSNGQWGRKDEKGQQRGVDWWISGSRGLLFPRAVPLTEASNNLKWNQFAQENLTTTGGKSLANYSKAFYNWTIICPAQNLEALKKWVYKFTKVNM